MIRPAILHRRRKLLLLGQGSGPQVASATFESADYEPPADGTTETALTFTGLLEGGAPAVGAAVQFALEGRVTVSASLSEVSADATTPLNVDVTVPIRLCDASGNGIAGIPAQFIVLAASGSDNVVTQPHGVTDADGYVYGAYRGSTAGLRTLTVTVGDLVLDDAPEVTVAADGPTLVFASEWDTATGGGLAAVTDTGRDVPWSGRVDQDEGDPAQNLDVVAASGVTLVNGGVSLASVGWPTANALRARWVSPGGVRSAGIVFASELWTHPAVGESVYLRKYFCHDGDDDAGGGTDDNSNHSFQSIGGGGMAGAGSAVYQLTWGNRGVGGAADGTFRFTVASLASGSSRFRPAVYLDKGAVYRVEYRIHRVATLGIAIHIRVYDSANTLVLQDSDFVLVASSTTLADNPELGLESDDITEEYLRNFALGAIGTGMPTDVACYYGAVAVSRTDWCGPYVEGEGPV